MRPLVASARLGVPIVFALTVAGCTKPPELDHELETLSSWTATMQLAREEHGAGAITTTYAMQLRDGALSALGEAKRTIGESAHTAVDSSYAAAALDSLRTAIRQLGAETGT